MSQPPPRAWVRVVRGRLVVTWATPEGEVRSRPLTRRERLAWWAAKRVPRP